MKKVCILGLWHLGCVTAACLSKRHRVVGWDPDGEVVENLAAGKPPIAEPGLADAISLAQEAGRLSFSADISSAVASADFVYFAFDIPVDDNDESDLSSIWEALEAAIPSMHEGQVVVVSSQVPVGTCRKMLEKFRGAKKPIGVCYAPENLQLGCAIEGFLKPSRLVLGLSAPSLESMIEELFSGIPGERLLMSLESAEMSKHAMNAYLASLISFSGEISDLCEGTGADARQVMRALLLDRRVSQRAPLMPGLGFGGGTLARDLQSLRAIGKKNSTPTPVLDAAFKANRERIGYVQKRLTEVLGDLKEKQISFFGLTYKPGTDTLRRSLALDIIRGIISAGAAVRAYDPAIKGAIDGFGHLQICTSAEECARGADALVIATAWPEFSRLDYLKICPLMRMPIIMDARNAIDSSALPPDAKYFGVGIGNGKRI